MRGEQLRLFTPDDDSNLKNRRRLIIIPLDTFVLSSVVIILLFILAFSLGVERGRKSYYSNLENKENLEKDIEDDLLNKPQAKVETSLPVETKKIQSRPANVINASRGVQAESKKEISPKVESTKPVTTTRYCIQIASYNKVELAQSEARMLQTKGFPVFILKKADYAVLYVGPFNSKIDADKSMGLIKKTYKDSILRRLQ